MNLLFSEYLKAGGDWLRSTLVMAQTSTQSNEISGVEEFIMYKDLRKELGKTQADELRSRKRLQQLACSASDTPYVMPHPDFPNDPDAGFNMTSVRIYRSER